MTIARAAGKKPVFRPSKYTWIQMQKGSMSMNLKCRWWTTSALSSSLLSWSCGWWRYLVEKMNSWSVGHCRAVEQTLGLRYRIEFFTRPGSRGMAWHGWDALSFVAPIPRSYRWVISPILLMTTTFPSSPSEDPIWSHEPKHIKHPKLNVFLWSAGWNIFDLLLVLVSFVDLASAFFTRVPWSMAERQMFFFTWGEPHQGHTC